MISDLLPVIASAAAPVFMLAFVNVAALLVEMYEALVRLGKSSDPKRRNG